MPVADLAAVQRGDRLIVQFTPSALTGEGMVIETPGEIDLRVGSAGVQPFHQPTWESGAEPLPVPISGEMARVRVETTVTEWIGKEVIFGLRQANKRGRWSVWSNLFPLRIIEPLAMPEEVRAENVAEGVRLAWSADGAVPGSRYRVFRRIEAAEVYSLVAEPEKPEWVDSHTVYETSYAYQVQRIAPAGDKWAESELSAAVAIQPLDRFPPPTPQGVSAVAGLDTIELTWEPVTATDLDGYLVYRSAGDGAETQPGEATSALSYTDRQLKSGERYRYRVASIDRLGNESVKSAAAEQLAP